ncbi:MAG: serine/threonine protein kinase [Pseudomonadota bacterium]
MQNHDPSLHPFTSLDPAVVADAVESLDFQSDGRTFALNSYENRVYQVGIEEKAPLIAKFYRPERWSDEQIDEEHRFTHELFDGDVSVVPPLVIDGRTLFRHRDFRFALFPRQGGHAPELDQMEHLEALGRALGRIHQLGGASDFDHRPRLDQTSFGHRSVDFLKQWGIPRELASIYCDLLDQALELIDGIYRDSGEVRYRRCHGDCHIGNILWRDSVPHFVDFDDARMAPAIQDLWMMLSGDRQEQVIQMDTLLEGYRLFCDFDPRELHLIEALRTLRVIHHSAWLARRWEDPAFPHAFPWFNTQRYWEEQVLALREQIAALQEPPIALFNM